ncbi:hypothetical protein SBRCBS47491_001392 [Sporothrix bragantina]|uniref:Uncharacterized protein n=1 Tax=Sporothrix bragantina TaxID=671064 RepID=A0ABP0AYF2_9PEZI
MSDRYGRSHRDPSRHRGRSPPSYRGDCFFVEDKSIQGDFPKSRNKGKEPEPGSRLEQGLPGPSRPEQSRGRGRDRDRGDRHDRPARPLSRSEQFLGNWNAFFKDYSNEYDNGVYTGPKPEGYVKPKPKVDWEAEARLTPFEQNWNAFFRDYSDEYTNGVYTGPKDPSLRPPPPSPGRVPAMASSSRSGPSRLPSRPPSSGRASTHGPPSFPSTSHRGSLFDTHPTGQTREYPPYPRQSRHKYAEPYTIGGANIITAENPSGQASHTRNFRASVPNPPPRAPSPPYQPPGGFPGGASCHRRELTRYPPSSSRHAATNFSHREPSRGRSRAVSPPRDYTRANSPRFARDFSRPPTRSISRNPFVTRGHSRARDFGFDYGRGDYTNHGPSTRRPATSFQRSPSRSPSLHRPLTPFQRSPSRGPPHRPATPFQRSPSRGRRPASPFRARSRSAAPVSGFGRSISRPFTPGAGLGPSAGGGFFGRVSDGLTGRSRSRPANPFDLPPRPPTPFRPSQTSYNCPGGEYESYYYRRQSRTRYI